MTGVIRSRPAAAAAAMMLMPVVAAAESAEHGGGSGELLWQAVNLAIVLGVLVWFGRKPILEFFAQRRHQITHDLEAAATLLQEAEARNSEIQRRLVDLDSQIEDLKEVAKHRAEDESERIIAEAQRTAERIRTDAEATVEQELRRARRLLRAEAAELALELAGGLLREQIGDGDRDRLLDEFITRVEPGPETSR